MELFSVRRWTTGSAQKTKQLCNVFKYSKLSKIFTLLERNNCRSADPVSHLLQLVKASLHQTSKDQYKLLASYFKAIFWYIFVERNGTPRNLFKQYLIQTIFVVVILHKYVSILQKISIKMPYLSYSLIPKSDLVVAIWDWK